jgi:hypothetical protein
MLKYIYILLNREYYYSATIFNIFYFNKIKNK